MTLASWLSLVMICIMGALSPGPSLAVVLRVTLTQSSKHGVATAIAHGFGVGLWAIVSMVGLAVLIQEYPQVFYWVSVSGGGYLIWMGIKALKYAGKGEVTEPSTSVSSYLMAMRDGLLVSLLNPKLALFFIALFSQFIKPEMGVLGQIEMWATVVFIDSAWYIIVALLLAGGPIMTWLRRNVRWVDRAMGSILIVLGTKVVLSS
ncbi:LysE family transporter [Marinomonas mediterranea]|uniref:Lysine exporter protein (LYSE/YGGA) n=1 Tax=Marinomonas mediterranea (strain ATCC 700492 / JCM 21426 / NBRC 103028 / MMB-1) TaxID=717774 RepID=F2K2A8_MARM1|nr:LysE family translocator [Marinomonas mediterranea]ADZ92288.1 Lysine exporter protein (LYSE/YGGA) [Marinomonas mediterranea MMB-1]WCN14287.1 LysE family transporter [Marinomonas mediterranea]WCN18339.1 LysE family transporter [Marinomonas mediterranea MMB-1]